MKVRILKSDDYYDYDAHTDHGHVEEGTILECGEHYAEDLVDAGLAVFVDEETNDDE